VRRRSCAIIKGGNFNPWGMAAMKLDNAIRVALEHENGVCTAYREAMKKCADEAGKRVFQALGNEEQYHVKYLEERLAEWQKTGKITVKKLGTSVPSREAITRSLDDVRKTVRPKRTTRQDVELESLRKALVAEVKTTEFYREMVAKLDGEGQALFQRFVEIEAGHEALVQAEIDAVSNSGVFLGALEFSLEMEP
jgi:rubrerythrin